MDGTGMSPAGTRCSVPAGVSQLLAPAEWGGPSEHQGGTWGHTRWLGAGTCCLAPRSTHGKAGGTRRAGVAGLPWRSLCRRRTMLSHLQCPSQVPKAHGASMSPLHSLLPHHSPAPLWLQQARQGHVPPGDPSEGEEKSCRGSPPAPARGCAHLAAQPGRVRGAKDLGTAHGVCDLHRPAPAPVCPAPPGTGEKDPLGTWLGSLHPRHWAQHPSVAGYAPTRTQVTAACAPHAVANGQDPRAALVPRSHGKLSAGWGGLHGVPSSWHPSHCPGHASDHSSVLV